MARACGCIPAGYDFADRFPQIAEAISNLPVQSCFIDGEAIVVDERGLSVFDLLRYRRHDHAAILCAFDLIELYGDDLRPLPIEFQKRRLEGLLRPARRPQTGGIMLNEHYEGDGAVIYKHVCTFGCEGIVSKRLSLPIRPLRSLAQDQEPGGAGGQTRGGGGLGPQAAWPLRQRRFPPPGSSRRPAQCFMFATAPAGGESGRPSCSQPAT
jgi:hypothetical protein